MIVTGLELKSFRNYEELNILLKQGTNLFYGDNAQGKTNVLEAVYLAGTTKSHRMGREREMIKFGAQEAHIRMDMEKNALSYRIDYHLRKNKKREIAINAVPAKKAGDLVGLGHFVFFSPEDLRMIKNGPAERRRFLDMELCQLERTYIHDLASYNHILMQRGRLLRDLEKREDYLDVLEILDEQLVFYGERVIKAREGFLSRLGEVIDEIHFRLSGGKERLEVSYEKNVEQEQFFKRLKEERERDIRYKITGIGPHRDDFVLKSNGIDLRRYGSQGQQRTAALSLKLAEIELVKMVSGDTPVLLLDDVLSELDQTRQRLLLQSIRQVQTLITCTGVEDFRENGFQIDQIFHVTEGRIEHG